MTAKTSAGGIEAVSASTPTFRSGLSPNHRHSRWPSLGWSRCHSAAANELPQALRAFFWILLWGDATMGVVAEPSLVARSISSAAKNKLAANALIRKF